MRHPARTLLTASALTVGLALVTLISVLAAGLKATINQPGQPLFAADYALTATNNFPPDRASPSAQALRAVPGVLVVAGVRAGDGRAIGSEINVTGVDRRPSRKVYRVKWKTGSNAIAARARADGAFVYEGLRERQPPARRPAAVGADPRRTLMHAHACAASRKTKRGSPSATDDLPRARRRIREPEDVVTSSHMRRRRHGRQHAAARHALASFPDARRTPPRSSSRTRRQDQHAADADLRAARAVVIVSLFGIVNTLILSIYERTRELGMMRAIGTSRRQMRQMIRYESIDHRA